MCDPGPLVDALDRLIVARHAHREGRVPAETVDRARAELERAADRDRADRGLPDRRVT